MHSLIVLTALPSPNNTYLDQGLTYSLTTRNDMGPAPTCHEDPQHDLPQEVLSNLERVNNLE